MEQLVCAGRFHNSRMMAARMEATMANVLHHHDARTFDVPRRVYWAAGVGLALLALLVLFTSAASDPAGTAAYLSDAPALPFTPFVPML
jgi:hypothetical protein